MVRLGVFTFVLLLFGGETGIKNCFAGTCPDLSADDADNLPQDQFVAYLTDTCRYDRNVRPDTSTPFQVNVKIDVTHLEAVQAQFTAYMTVRLTYIDRNLNYTNISPKRTSILGDESLKQKIWTPNLFLKDQNETSVVGLDAKDTLITIDPLGQVTYSYKMVAQYYVWMDLRKFPFDNQKSRLTFSDWSNNSTDLVLIWSKDFPFSIAQNLHLTEFVMDETSYSTGNNFGPYQGKELTANNFSEIIIDFKFHRDVGYYLLDFFIPSFLLVFTAWVTFWLQADATPPRATLGSSTVVAFITLHLGVSKDIPKVSYIKASDIWFLGVMCFIFLSLAEFAFVNVIWRRKKIVELKKPSHKHILKGAVMPRKAREDLRRYESQVSIVSQSDSNKSQNWPNSNYIMDPRQQNQNYGSREVLGRYNSQLSNDTLTNGSSTISIPVEETQTREFSWTTMTPKEVSIYVDRKARIVFPIAFFIFNVFYWIFVYCL